MTQVVVAAAVQATPMFLDRDATVEKVVELTAKAATEGAGLVVFPEAFVPTYPDWVWRAPARSDRPFYERLAAGSVTVPSAATELPEGEPSQAPISDDIMRNFYANQLVEPDVAVALAAANSAIEGVELDDAWQEELRQVADGRVTADELIQREIGQHLSDR